jgi:hypothetical protein
MQELFKKDNEIAAAGSKRSAEGEEIDETESLSTKTARTDSSIENIMRLKSSGEEGICVIPPQCKCIVLSHAAPFAAQMHCTCYFFIVANWLHMPVVSVAVQNCCHV